VCGRGKVTGNQLSSFVWEAEWANHAQKKKLAYSPSRINRFKSMPSNHARATSGELKKRVANLTIEQKLNSRSPMNIFSLVCYLVDKEAIRLDFVLFLF